MTLIAMLALLAADPQPKAPGPLAPPGISRVLVLELSSTGVEASVATSLTEVLTQSLRQALPAGVVLGQSEINSMIALEKQRDLVGCASDIACLAEIGGALGADHLVVGSAGKVGTLYLLSVKLLNSARATTVRHVTAEVAAHEERLVEAARQLARALVDTAAPIGYGVLDIACAPSCPST